MKLRTLIIVAVALAIVTMAGFFIRNSSLTTPEDDPLIGKQVFEQDALADLSRIEINKDGSAVILEKDEKGAWLVRSLYDLPVDFGKLNTFIRNLVEAKIERKITGREDRLQRLDLTDGPVKLLSSDGKTLLDITFGKSLSNGGKAFVLGKEKTAFLTASSPLVDSNATNWAMKTLYEFKADDVAGIQFSLSGETWGVRRDDKDKDFVSTLPVDARKPKQSAIKSLITRFNNLRFVSVSERPEEEKTQVWKDAQKNTRLIKFTLFSGQTITVKMSQWEPAKPEGEEAPASTEPAVTYLAITSSQADHPINNLTSRLAFKASSYTFTGIPKEIAEVADLPQPEPAPEPEESGENSGQPEIKQHIDGNSVIFEVNPGKKGSESAPSQSEESAAPSTP